MLSYLGLFISSAIVSLVLVLFLKHVFYRFKILDNPKKYKKKRSPIPYSMGVVFFIAFFAMSAISVEIGYLEYSYKLGLIWIFGFFITAISFLDDRMNVSAKTRLIFQIIIGAIIGITSIKIGYVSNIFGGIINLETFFIDIFEYKIYLVPLLFTIVWYVFVFNAINWTDGISGNTSGIALISFFIILLLGVILYNRDSYEGGVKNAEFIIKICIILIGIIIPFWYFDIKEKILMGDSGTMFLGFMLATLAIIAGGKIATVLVVFGIYSVDAVYVIVNRLLKKKNPLSGDFTHLHHRLEKIGLTKTQILSLIFGLSFFFGITALFLERTGKIMVFLIIVFVVVFLNKIIETLLPKKNKKVEK